MNSIDSKVLEALESRDIWKAPRGTGPMGCPIVRRSELAKHLKLDRSDVVGSLNRLEAVGKVFDHGSTIDQPDDPQYYFLHR